jgi:hypothetical protein
MFALSLYKKLPQPAKLVSWAGVFATVWTCYLIGPEAVVDRILGPVAGACTTIAEEWDNLKFQRQLSHFYEKQASYQQLLIEKETVAKQIAMAEKVKAGLQAQLQDLHNSLANGLQKAAQDVAAKPPPLGIGTEDLEESLRACSALEKEIAHYEHSLHEWSGLLAELEQHITLLRESLLQQARDLAKAQLQRNIQKASKAAHKLIQDAKSHP